MKINTYNRKIRSTDGPTDSGALEKYISDAEVLAIENRQKARRIAEKIRRRAHETEWRDLRRWDAEREAAIKVAAHYGEVARRLREKAADSETR